MNRMFIALIALPLILAAPSWAKDSDDDSEKTGGTSFVPYDGDQGWPTSKSPAIDQSHSIPVYEGLPDKKYKVIGRIIDDREGFDLVGKELGGFFGGSKKAFRNITNQARKNGGEAVVITEDSRVIEQFGVERRKRKDTSPLNKNREALVLVVTF